MDGRKIGTSPDIIKDIIVGNHNIEIRKLGYITKKTNIKIKESEISKLDGTLDKQVSGTSIIYDGGSYKGQLVDGKPHGKGRITYKDGSYYDGNWVNGKKEGNGKYYDPESNIMQEGVYINGICSRVIDEYVVGSRNNNSSSNATIRYGGGFYKGQLVDGKPHGKGRLTYRDGSYYDGNWVNGQKNGNGKYYDSDTNIMQEGVYLNGICSRVLNEYKMPRK